MDFNPTITNIFLSFLKKAKAFYLLFSFWLKCRTQKEKSEPKKEKRSFFGCALGVLNYILCWVALRFAQLVHRTTLRFARV
ncbi:hypothetical protein IJ425_05950 [bacterium]|nr:hypothetical protein [bacterium]